MSPRPGPELPPSSGPFVCLSETVLVGWLALLSTLDDDELARRVDEAHDYLVELGDPEAAGFLVDLASDWPL